MPQWSPVMKTGNTSSAVDMPCTASGPQWSPVMKTGNTLRRVAGTFGKKVPQWSPVMKTGNTSPAGPTSRQPPQASMEPGHEDREYPTQTNQIHETRKSLNGARS